MSATATREAWEAGPPDDARFAPAEAYQQRREQLPAVPGAVADDQLPQAIGEALVPIQMLPPEPLPAKPSAAIARRVSAVMSEIERIEKRGHNKHFNFDFATIDDIRAALARLCGKHGLAWRQTELRVFPLGKLLGVTYQFTLLAEDEPEHEAFPSTVTVLAAIQTRSGLDEKAFSKARALAWKDWAKSQFAIPTGEDPDDADPDAGGGAPADRRGPPPRNGGNGNGQAEPATGRRGAYCGADGKVHLSETPEEWEAAWNKRIQAFVAAKRLDDLRAAYRANALHIDASDEAGQRVKAAILAALPKPPGAAEPPADEAGEKAAAAPAEVKPPAVKRAKNPDEWVKNLRAAIFQCDSILMLDALVVRERPGINTIESQHADLHAAITRSVMERRVALEQAAKGS